MGQHREIRVKLHNGRPFGGLISLTGSRERSEWRWKKCEVSEFCFTYNYHCGDQRAERRSLYIHPGELVIFGPLGCSDLTVINVPTHLDGIDKVIYYRRFCVYSRNEAVSLKSSPVTPPRNHNHTRQCLYYVGLAWIVRLSTTFRDEIGSKFYCHQCMPMETPMHVQSLCDCNLLNSQIVCVISVLTIWILKHKVFEFGPGANFLASPGSFRRVP